MTQWHEWWIQRKHDIWNQANVWIILGQSGLFNERNLVTAILCTMYIKSYWSMRNWSIKAFTYHEMPSFSDCTVLQFFYKQWSLYLFPWLFLPQCSSKYQLHKLHELATHISCAPSYNYKTEFPHANRKISNTLLVRIQNCLYVCICII